MPAFPRQRQADVSHLRIPPHSIEAEQSVLGGLMLSSRAVDAVASRLREDDFYRRDHALIFRAIVSLADQGQPCDAVTLGEWFERQGLEEQVGGAAYVIELASTTPSAANVMAYAEIVRSKSLLRRLIDVATEAACAGFEPGDKSADTVIDDAVSALMGMQRVNTSAEFTLGQAMRLAWQDMMNAAKSDRPYPGLATGLTKLDERMGGLHAGDLIVVGARPSMGKTALLFGMADTASDEGPIGMISGEQSARQLGQRLIARRTGIVASKMRAGMLESDEWNRVSSAVADCRDVPMHILDRSAPSLGEVMRTARRWKREKGIRALYVDYLQRITGKGKDRVERVSDVALGLKTIARELDIPVVALAQVSRGVEARPDKRPRMGDLSDSSEIEKEADQIVMLYRDEYYNPDSPDKGTAELLIEKNRHGETGFVRVAWLAQTMRFADLDPNWRREQNAEPPEDHGKHVGKGRNAKPVPVDAKAKAAGT